MWNKVKKIILILTFFALLQVSSFAVTNIKQGHFDFVNDIVKYPFGNVAITCSNDETIIIWDFGKDEIIKSLVLGKGGIAKKYN